MWKTINLDRFTPVAPHDMKSGSRYIMYANCNYWSKSRRLITFRKDDFGMYYIIDVDDVHYVIDYTPQLKIKNLMFDLTGYIFYNHSDIYKFGFFMPSLSSLAFYQLSTAELQEINHNLCLRR
jgi:hypothetical protein